jgi:hypothetical protein
MRAVLLAGALAISFSAAVAEELDDLRGLSVGAAVADLPTEGFAGFACAAPPGAALAGWRDWATCPADPAGRHEMRFRYADGDTKVAGHPVLLGTLFDAGRLAVLRISTDPAAPLFLRKKAFLLGLQARHRYGEDAWACTDTPAAGDEEPVGGVFVKQACSKSVPGRDVVVERTLLRHAGSAAREFVGESRVTVTAAH